MQTFEYQIAENIYNYNPHVELIKLLRQRGEFDQLRAAREHMSSVFPLTAGKMLGHYSYVDLLIQCYCTRVLIH